MSRASEWETPLQEGLPQGVRAALVYRGADVSSLESYCFWYTYHVPGADLCYPRGIPATSTKSATHRHSSIILEMTKLRHREVR